MPRQYNPETILEERHATAREQLQQYYRTQWDDVNRRARAGLFRSQKERDELFYEIRLQSTQALNKFDQQAEQEINRLNEINRLAELGAIQNPDEVKWRLVMGPEAEQAMFPRQVDPRDEYREILTTENMVLKRVKEFVVGRDGMLYQAKEDEDGYLTDQPDKNNPASQQQIEGWIADAYALEALGQAKIEAAQQVTSMSVQDPNRLQNLFQDRVQTRERQGFLNWLFKDWWSETKFRMRGGALKELKRIRAKKGGTFAQKVEQTLTTKPGPGRGIVNQPTVQKKKLTPEIARRFMLQYGNRKDAQAAAEAEGYYE